VRTARRWTPRTAERRHRDCSGFQPVHPTTVGLVGGLDIGFDRSRRRMAPLPTAATGADFVAIDFETANSTRSSACAIGVAVVGGGQVRAHGSTLINPECDFDGYNIAITGIRPEDVADAPTFDQVWPHLSELLSGHVVAAHVATFDLGVLRQSVARYELPGIDARALCSWRLARRAWKDYPSFGLAYLSGALGLNLDHHEAGSDAAACAGVVLAALRIAKATGVDDYCERTGFMLGTLDPSSFIGINSNALPDLRNLEGSKDADPDHPLYGRQICFTGAMYSMTRREAAALIVEFGADFKNNVSTKVNTLVIGDADFVQFADGMQTGKMKRAAELKEDGHDIEVMAERDFLSMLRS
jgi:DNA polymerase III subunit epsilon